MITNNFNVRNKNKISILNKSNNCRDQKIIWFKCFYTQIFFNTHMLYPLNKTKKLLYNNKPSHDFIVFNLTFTDSVESRFYCY